jgi:hypothetical protein
MKNWPTASAAAWHSYMTTSTAEATKCPFFAANKIFLSSKPSFQAEDSPHYCRAERVANAIET